jgi:hypothetical protein
MEPGREGGMWLGVSVKPPAIKFGALLNVTGEEKRQATSGRGPLVHDYLKTDETALGLRAQPAHRDLQRLQPVHDGGDEGQVLRVPPQQLAPSH